jgi:hypothetical protein
MRTAGTPSGSLGFSEDRIELFSITGNKDALDEILPGEHIFDDCHSMA